MAVVRKFITVDDSIETISVFKRAVDARNKKNRDNIDFVPISNEAEALDLIYRYRRSNSLPVFFLDLNITDHLSGLRILKAIRSKKSLRNVPVVIVSNSDDDDTVSKSFKLGANAYHTKGDTALISRVVNYWDKNADDKSVLAKRFRD